MGMTGVEAQEGGEMYIYMVDSLVIQQKLTHFKTIIFQLKKLKIRKYLSKHISKCMPKLVFTCSIILQCKDSP